MQRGPRSVQAKLAEHQRQLLRDAQRRRQPKGGNDPVAQEPALHQHAVRRQDGGRHAPRLAQQLVIRNVRLPGGLVAGGPQPPRQPAQAGIAQEEDGRWLGSGRLERLAGGEPLIDLRQGVGQGNAVRARSGAAPSRPAIARLVPAAAPARVAAARGTDPRSLCRMRLTPAV